MPSLSWVPVCVSTSWLFTIYNKFPENPVGKSNGARPFESFQWKISERNGTSEKVVLFSRSECSKRKFVFDFFKPIFDTSFRLSQSLFGKWDWFLQMVDASPERNLPVLNFVYHLPKPWSDRFAHVNGKQHLKTKPWILTIITKQLNLFSLHL